MQLCLKQQTHHNILHRLSKQAHGLASAAFRCCHTAHDPTPCKAL